MVELDYGLGLNGLPTAKCATHNLVLQAEPFSEDGTLTLIKSTFAEMGHERNGVFLNK